MHIPAMAPDPSRRRAALLWRFAAYRNTVWDIANSPSRNIRNRRLKRDLTYPSGSAAQEACRILKRLPIKSCVCAAGGVAGSIKSAKRGPPNRANRHFWHPTEKSSTDGEQNRHIAELGHLYVKCTLANTPPDIYSIY